MYQIKSIHAREILDSRGFPTVEAEVRLASGVFADACVPSGASTGSFEALELRDNDSKRYKGKGVLTAVHNVLHKIGPVITNKTFESQANLDAALIDLDGTPNKNQLGANALLSVSLAFAKACAKQHGVYLFEHIANITNNTPSLPVPMMNILNGGAHADNNVDIQEFMIMPIQAQNWGDALRMGAEIYHALKAVLKSNQLMTAVGDEGGFAPNLASNQEALDKIMAAIEKAGFKPGSDIYLALDVAANELYRDGHYYFDSEKKSLSASQLVDTYEGWLKAYPIISIEDAMQEQDMLGWQEISTRLGDKAQLVGDDVFVTNPEKLKQGIKDNIANAILIKLNQIGTLSETLETIKIAKDNQYNNIISHRSGETEDCFIADLAVGTNAMQIKTGAPARTDRVVKYNQLTRIADRKPMPYAGLAAFKSWIK